MVTWVIHVLYISYHAMCTTVYLRPLGVVGQVANYYLGLGDRWSTITWGWGTDSQLLLGVGEQVVNYYLGLGGQVVNYYLGLGGQVGNYYLGLRNRWSTIRYLGLGNRWSTITWGWGTGGQLFLGVGEQVVNYYLG